MKIKFSLVCLITALAVCLSSCNNSAPTSCSCGTSSSTESTSQSVHEHVFNNGVWEYNEVQHWHPSTCGHDVTSEKQNHIFIKTEQSPTFENDGYITYKCSVCGYYYVVKGEDKLIHNYSDEWSYDDFSHWHACIDIGYEYLRSDETNHVFNEVVVSPTYENIGYTSHTCTECGYTYTDTMVDKLTHNYSTEWSYDNYRHWHACIDAGYEDLKTDRAYHTFDNVVVDPTYESSGYTTHTCTVCGYSYNDNETDRLKINITWKNYNDTVLATESYYYGEMPSYKGTTPIKERDEQYSYSFSGWTPEITNAVEDTIYTATFTSKLEKAKIIFDLNGGTTSHPSSPIYRSSIEAEDFFFDVVKDSCNFRGWSYNEQLVFDYNGNKVSDPAIEEEMVFVAMFEKNVAVTIITNNPNGGSFIGAGIYPYNTNVKVTATPNDGYYFIGWYYDNNLLSNQETYNYMMWDQDVILEARWGFIEYSITYELDGGANSTNNPSTYNVEDEIVLQNATKTGHSFIGWLLNDEYISKIERGTMGDLLLVASYSINSYNINAVSSDESKGIVSGSGSYVYNSEVTLTATSKEHCQFDGWFIGDEQVGYRETYTFKVPANSVNLIARFSYKAYTLYLASAQPSYGSVMFKGDANYTDATSKQITYTESVSVAALTTTDERSFLGWFNENDELVSTNAAFTFDMIHDEYYLFAKWDVSDDSYALSTTSSNDVHGTVTNESGSYKYGEIVTVEANASENYFFKGWYHNDIRVSKNLKYSFAMPESDYSLVGVFWLETEQETWDKNHGVIPVVNSGINTITYGLYPQVHVNDASLISSLDSLAEIRKPEANGWYFYNDEYYAKIIGDPLGSNATFNDGVLIVAGFTYWFKCNLITWKILTDDYVDARNEHIGYYLLTSVLLDAHRYDSSKKSYVNSELRSWANNEFYYSAFGLNDEYIQVTCVDNSTSTKDSTGYYTEANTKDKVFFPSYRDYLATRYGFSNTTYSLSTRVCKVTDFSKARGAHYSSEGSTVGNGDYLTRSPSSYYSNLNTEDVWSVAPGGYITKNNSINWRGSSVRPSITLKLS